MKKSIVVLLAISLVMVFGTVAMATNQAPGTGIRGTSHDLSSATGVGATWGAGTAADSMDRICIYCHAPHHSANQTDVTSINGQLTGGAKLSYYPLWNHEVSVQSYATFTDGSDSPTSIQHQLNANIGQPGSVSRLCLSCHDGSVAISSYGHFDGGTSSSQHAGSIKASGRILIGGSNDLTNHHPIGFDYTQVLAADDEIAPTDTQVGLGTYNLTIGDLLWNNKMECSSCHDVHNTKNEGKKFLWVEDTGSALCLTCHLK